MRQAAPPGGPVGAAAPPGGAVAAAPVCRATLPLPFSCCIFCYVLDGLASSGCVSPAMEATVRPGPAPSRLSPADCGASGHPLPAHPTSGAPLRDPGRALRWLPLAPKSRAPVLSHSILSLFILASPIAPSPRPPRPPHQYDSQQHGQPLGICRESKQQLWWVGGPECFAGASRGCRSRQLACRRPTATSLILPHAPPPTPLAGLTRPRSPACLPSRP